uniref:Uncharacterized protein n=1 Tax=Seriola lalandi dorsalis TaxID=1841481 RepID=A0A3B4XI75_SERLL
YSFRNSFHDFCEIIHLLLLRCKYNKDDGTEVAFSSVSSTLSSPRTSDTDILYTSEEKSPMMRPDPWPSAFDIPDFSVDVNFRLRQGDLACMQEGIRMDVSRDMKHVILERLAEAMYKYTAYPTEEHCQEVAAALIAKHPCLKEAGSPTGYCGWKNSIKFKMGNFRTKMRRSGMADVTVNGNKRKRDFPEGAPSCSNIKRAKRSETNFLPNFPDGENADSLESVRRQLENEAKKRLPDSADVKKMMDKTFALRRKEVVEEQPPVKRMMERWPVLFTEIINIFIVSLLFRCVHVCVSSPVLLCCFDHAHSAHRSLQNLPQGVCV